MEKCDDRKLVEYNAFFTFYGTIKVPEDTPKDEIEEAVRMEILKLDKELSNRGIILEEYIIDYV